MAAACMQASSSSSRQQQGTDSRQILRGLRCPQKVGILLIRWAEKIVVDLSDEVKLRWIQFISVKLTVAQERAKIPSCFVPTAADPDPKQEGLFALLFCSYSC